MKLRHPILISSAAWLLARSIRIWMGLAKKSYVNLGRDLLPKNVGSSEHFIYAFWHENLLLPAPLFGRRDIHVLISQHADGQLISEVAEHLGYRTVRGSSTRGGMSAVRNILALASTSHFVITPDGPRGPRRQVQSGLLYLASRTGLPIVPVGMGYDRPWRAKSWDRFAVPRPFRRAIVLTDRAIAVPADADRDTLEQYRAVVQQQLDSVTAAAEARATGAARTLPVAARAA